MISLGFSVGHEMGAVLIKDEEVLIGISEERLNRKKYFGAYSYQLPLLSIEYCLENTGISLDQVDTVVYNAAELPDNYHENFSKHFKFPIDRIQYIPHHLAHAFSTFYSSGFSTSTVLVIDASGSEVGSETSTSNPWYPEKAQQGKLEGKRFSEIVSIFHFDENGWEEKYKRWIDFPKESSVGILYESGAHQLTFDPISNGWQAGKLMGMASYADPLFVDHYPPFVEFRDGGEEPYIPFTAIDPQITYTHDFQTKANYAGVYQREHEKLIQHYLEKSRKISDSNNICVAGGSFLNCNSNELICKSNLFENKYFLPSASDSGIALGCAWYGQSGIKSGKYLSPYLGKTYSKEKIIYDIFHSGEKIIFKEYTNWEELYDVVANLLVENKVIGWFQDGSETGPRALGNRSILANPGTYWMEKHINFDIKEREWYRPFAPSVLAEKQMEIFDLDEFSPYMLITTKVKKEWQHKIPAVTHIDETSRYQSVSPEMNFKYHSLITKFYEKTGIPLLLNTSFNGKDEPIVETPAEAIRTYVKIGLDVLVVANMVITKVRDIEEIYKPKIS